MACWPRPQTLITSGPKNGVRSVPPASIDLQIVTRLVEGQRGERKRVSHQSRAPSWLPAGSVGRGRSFHRAERAASIRALPEGAAVALID
jgi:hypothetical protein